MAKTTNKNFWPAVILIVLGLALALGGIGAAKNIANVLITIIGVILIAYGILSIFSLGLMLLGIITSLEQIALLLLLLTLL